MNRLSWKQESVMTQKQTIPNRPKPVGRRPMSAEEACANLEKLGITEDDIADAVRWARSNSIGGSERWNSSKL